MNDRDAADNHSAANTPSAAAGQSQFSAILTPHRSLGPRGFLILMSAIGAVSFVTGLAFLMIGAWPVMGFFGLDVLLIYVAFKLNYRAARQYETIELNRDALMVTRVDPSGRHQNWHFNPYWVRLSLEGKSDDRTVLTLHSHGRQLVIAHQLSNEERQEFVHALSGALVLARSGATG